MTNYIKAFQEGIDAAKIAERARNEVNEVFSEFDKEMRIVSDGRLGIERKIFPDDLIAEIYRISKGNICNINNICFELLIQAANNSKEIIEMSLLDKLILPT